MSTDIDLALLDESPTNPRTEYDPDDIEQLAQSIVSVGILQPIVARPKGDRLEIVCGHRRTRAARAAELTEIPAIVREMTDDEVLEAQLVENSQRKDVRLLEEGRTFARMIDAGRTVESIADRIGRRPRYVIARAGIPRLPEILQPLCDDERMTLEAVAILQSLKENLRTQIVEAMAEEEGRERQSWEHPPRWNRTSVIRLIERAMRRLANAPWSLDDETLDPPVRGACATCPLNSATQGDLFGDHEASCTDAECWSERTAHYWKLAVEAWDGPIAESTEGLNVFYSASYNDSEAGVWKFIDRAFLTEAGIEVEEVLVKDQHGEGYTRRMTVEAVETALRAAGHDDLADVVIDKGPRTSPADDWQKKAKAAKKARVTRIAKVVELLEEGKVTGAALLEPMFQLLVTGGNQQPAIEILKRRGMEKEHKDGDDTREALLMKAFASANAKERWGLMAEFLMWHSECHRHDESDAFKHMRRLARDKAKAKAKKKE